MTENPWLKFWSKASAGQPALRLFCFHHAGGSAALFREWPRLIEPGYEIVGIQLPGREHRLRETPYDSLKSLLPALHSAIASELTTPFAFFGHSMGSLLAFELTRELRRAGAGLPVCLFVSSRGGPVAGHPPPLRMPALDQDLLSMVQQRYGGIPEKILRDSEMMKLLLPALRADLTILDTYSYEPEPPLPIPIAAFGGSEDHAVPPNLLQNWEAQTSNSFRVELFRGDHFYLKQMPYRLAASISSDIAETLKRATVEAGSRSGTIAIE